MYEVKKDDLILDKRNYRKHGKKNLALIKKSINENGFGRSIVIDNDNSIVCGNGVFETLPKNTKIKVIETDGNELIAIKRKDLKADDEKRKQLAILDNSTGDLSEFDLELLKLDFNLEELGDLGIDVPDVNDDHELKEIDLNEVYEVVCECSSEEEQQAVFDKLIAEGLKCRILTL